MLGSLPISCTKVTLLVWALCCIFYHQQLYATAQQFIVEGRTLSEGWSSGLTFGSAEDGGSFDLGFEFWYAGSAYTTVQTDGRGIVAFGNITACYDGPNSFAGCLGIVPYNPSSNAHGTLQVSSKQGGRLVPTETNRASPTKGGIMAFRWKRELEDAPGSKYTYMVILQAPSRILIVYEYMPDPLKTDVVSGLFVPRGIPTTYDPNLSALAETFNLVHPDINDSRGFFPLPTALLKTNTMVQITQFSAYSCLSPSTIYNVVSPPLTGVYVYITNFADPTFVSSSAAPELPLELANIPNFVETRLECDFAAVSTVTPPLTSPPRSSLSWDSVRQAWKCQVPAEVLATVDTAGGAQQSTVQLSVSIVVRPTHAAYSDVSAPLTEYRLYTITRESGPLNVFSGHSTIDERDHDLPATTEELDPSHSSSKVLAESVGQITLEELNSGQTDVEPYTDADYESLLCSTCAQHRWTLSPASLVAAPSELQSGKADETENGITSTYLPLGRAAIGRGRDICYLDCHGTRGGTAVVDRCGVCSGGLTSHVPDSDVQCGICFGDAVSPCPETASTATVVSIDELTTDSDAKEAAQLIDPTASIIACSSGGHVCRIFQPYVPEEVIKTIKPLNIFKLATLAVTAVCCLIAILHVLGGGTWQRQSEALTRA